MKEILSRWYAKDSVKKILSSLISILIGLCVGALLVLITGIFKSTISGKGIWEGIRIVFLGILSTGRDANGALSWGLNASNLGNMLFRATPLIMTGLSVGVAYKTGLFNIGAPGQYLMGTMTSLAIALSIPSEVVPAWLIWISAVLGAALAGALWGAIPGIVKAFFNINEVPETDENIGRDRMEHSSYIYATEKKDGSTIIVSNYKNKPLITTNGSFDNEQTKLAKEIFNEKYPKFLPNVDKGYTFIFELIHPDNKIVIDYGDEKALYLLAVRDLNTEKLLSLDETHDLANQYGFPYPKVYDFENLDVMVNLAHTLKNANQEGWVLRIGNKDGEFMAKLKLDEYFEMHKTFGKVSTKWVYRHIVNNDLDDFLALCDEDRKKDVFAEIDKINAVKEMVREKVINEAKYYLGKYGVKNFAEIEQDKQKMIQMIQEILNSRTPTCAMCVSYLRDSSKIDTSLERLTIKAFRGFLQEYEEKENNKEIEK